MFIWINESDGGNLWCDINEGLHSLFPQISLKTSHCRKTNKLVIGKITEQTN